MTNEEYISLNYFQALGTPLPVGTSVRVNGQSETIERYEFTTTHGLMAVTNNGNKLSDYDQIANGSRRLRIKRFLADNANLKLEVKTTKAARFYKTI